MSNKSLSSSSKTLPPSPLSPAVSSITKDRSPDGKFCRQALLENRNCGKLIASIFEGLNAETEVKVVWTEMRANEISKDEWTIIFEKMKKVKDLKNPYISEVFDCWGNIDAKGDKIVTFITENLVRGSLHDKIKLFKNMHIKDLKSWCRQILHGLDYLHSQDPPIVHGSLNCRNIYLAPKAGGIKMDVLGLLKAGYNQNEFLAKEDFGEQVDEKSDIYAFGMCLLEFVTGELPYAECQQSSNSICGKVCRGEKPHCFYRIPAKYSETTHIIRQCISLKKDERPTAKELLEMEFFSIDDTKPIIVNQKENPTKEFDAPFELKDTVQESPTLTTTLKSWTDSIKEALQRRPDIAYPSTPGFNPATIPSTAYSAATYQPTFTSNGFGNINCGNSKADSAIPNTDLKKSDIQKNPFFAPPRMFYSPESPFPSRICSTCKICTPFYIKNSNGENICTNCMANAQQKIFGQQSSGGGDGMTKCARCKTSNTFMWVQSIKGDIVCMKCNVAIFAEYNPLLQNFVYPDFPTSAGRHKTKDEKTEALNNSNAKESGPSNSNIILNQPAFVASLTRSKESKLAPSETKIQIVHEKKTETSAPNSSSTLNDAFTTKKYSDVVFLTNDSKKVFAHRCILFSHSEIFTALFDQKPDIPSEIEVDFSQDVVIRALQFCYGNSGGIKDFERDLIKFAEAYEIKGLKEACIKSFEDQYLTVDNVCDCIRIAFEFDIPSMKGNCLDFIKTHKKEIGEEKLSKLPAEILVAAFLSA